MIDKTNPTGPCSQEPTDRNPGSTLPDLPTSSARGPETPALPVPKFHDAADLNLSTGPAIKQFWKGYKAVRSRAPKPDRASYYARSLVAFRLQIALFLIALFLAAFYSSVPKPTSHSITVGFVIVEGMLFLGSWISGFMVSGPEDLRGIFYSASSLAEGLDRCAKREDYIVRVLRENYSAAVRKGVRVRVKQAIDLEKGRMDAAGGIGALFPAGALAVSALLFASDLPTLWKGVLSVPSFVVTLLAITSKLGFVDLQQMVFFLERAEDEDKKGHDTRANNGSDELGQVGDPKYDSN